MYFFNNSNTFYNGRIKCNTYRGRKNLSKELKEEAVYSGEMTEDKLWLALKEVRDKKSDEIKYKPAETLMIGLVKSYPGILYNENRIEDFPDTYAKNFYNCWRKNLGLL